MADIETGVVNTDDFIADARAEFDRISEVESDNRQAFEDDLRFSRHGDQWDSRIRKQREDDGRPCLTINRMLAFIRQVVNDARQNKPSIKAHPIDDQADVETAKIIDGLFRNIEHISDADIAYDTAIEYAVSGNVGYIQIDIDYANDDAFDQDIVIRAVPNPLAVYPDCDDFGADSAGWERCFVLDRLSKHEFERRWGNVSKKDWDDEAWNKSGQAWKDDESCTVANYWYCEYVDEERFFVQDMQDGSRHVYDAETFESEHMQNMIQIGRLQVMEQRTVQSRKIMRATMTGSEVLEEIEWPGRYIPIIPVYGEDYVLEGKRYLRSLIHHAKDSQRMFNAWRSTSTELTALAPRVPWIGPKGAFATDSEKWETANTRSWSYLEYDDKGAPPQRQPLDTGPAVGAIQESLNASDDMKAVLGIYDASLGARSNETSGRAIMARQREGDTSTFHFVDNLNRAIRHVGRVVLDLIPNVYSEHRIVRVMGEDGVAEQMPLKQPVPKMDQDGNPMTQDGGPPAPDRSNVIMQMHDLSLGKYDIAVSSGPSYNTRREEAAYQMTELIRAFPQAAPFVADILAKNFDWPGAQEIAERFKGMVPGQQQQGIPPELQQQMQQGMQRIQQLEQENQQLKAELSIDMKEAQTKQFDAETKRMKVQIDQKKAQADIGTKIVDRIFPQTDAPQYPNGRVDQNGNIYRKNR